MTDDDFGIDFDDFAVGGDDGRDFLAGTRDDATFGDDGKGRHDDAEDTRVWPSVDDEDIDQHERVIYGSYPADDGNDPEFDPGTGSRNYSTKNSDDRRERERIDNARMDGSNVSSRSATIDGGRDAARRVNQHNERAVKEAIRRLAGDENVDSGKVTATGRTVATESKRNISVVDIESFRKLAFEKDFPGCEFEATLNKMFLNVHGEWIVQFKVRYEDRVAARELDGTAGLALKINVEQI